jgi:hypothetical protein
VPGNRRDAPFADEPGSESVTVFEAIGFLVGVAVASPTWAEVLSRAQLVTPIMKIFRLAMMNQEYAPFLTHLPAIEPSADPLRMQKAVRALIFYNLNPLFAFTLGDV